MNDMKRILFGWMGLCAAFAAADCPAAATGETSVAPVTYDLVIAGGTLEGVRHAVREAAAGRKVYLVAPRP